MKNSNLKHDFFAVPNIVNSYWAGFIAADGDRGEENYRLGMHLNLKDLRHLEKFKRIINSDNKIQIKQNTNSCMFRITSNKIVNDLYINFNITHRKSKTLKFPDQLFQYENAEDLIRSFIRGYIDGDGSFYTDRRVNRNSYVIEMLSTLSFCLHIRHYIKLYTGLLFNIGVKSKYRNTETNYYNDYYYRIYKVITSNLHFIDWLYKDSTEFTRLDRKYAIVTEWLQ
jgi:hypothetical protein